MFLLLVLLGAQPFLTELHKPEKAAAGCVIDVIGQNPNSSPLVANSSGNFMDPLALNDLRVHFNQNETFWIACPGGDFTSPLHLIARGELAVCVSGNTVSIQGETALFNQISCNLDDRRPYLLDAADGYPCEVSGTITTIGYDCSGGHLAVYDACMNSQNALAFYVKYVISRWANALRDHTPCNTIRSFDITIPPLYDRSYTRKMLQDLGYDDDFYLEEGQLAANNDFFYPFQRDATSCYTNIAPQWHMFKEGNWAATQRSITTLIRQGAHGDFIAYSGTLGVTSLEDKINGGVPFLYLERPRLPVPRWFWKLIYSPATQSGNVIFGYNNPYITLKEDVDTEFLFTICLSDQLATLTWLTGIDNTDSQFGYTYACSLNEVIDAGVFEVVQNLLRNVKHSFIENLHST